MKFTPIPIDYLEIQQEIPVIFIREPDNIRKLIEEDKEIKVIIDGGKKEIVDSEKLKNIREEIRGCSITPTTFQDREFENSIEDPIFTDHFRNYSVLRFGLNNYSKELLEEVNSYNNLKGSEKALSIASTKDRFNNITEIENYRKYSEKLLTRFEKYNIEKAIRVLKEGKNIAVVVDVFRRDSEHPTILFKDDLPEIHSTVLYSCDGKYLIIDPNNAAFSSILVGADRNIRACFSSKVQIYKAGSSTGPETWRDCIDIAVKLAFHLTVNSKLGLESIGSEEMDMKKPEKFIETQDTSVGQIDASRFRSSFSVKEITNQLLGNDGFPDAIRISAFRIKQSSNVLENKKVTFLLTKVESILSKLREILIEGKYTHIAKNYEKEQQSLIEKIFSSTEKYEESFYSFVNNLMVDLGSKNSNISKMIEDEISLIGDEIKLFVEEN